MIQIFFAIIFLPLRLLIYSLWLIKNLPKLFFKVITIEIDDPIDAPPEVGFVKLFKPQKHLQYVLLTQVFWLIKYCSKCKRRPNILIKVNRLNGSARAWEWSQAIKRLRENNFEVHSYLNQPGTLTLLATCESTSVTVSPSATIDMTWGFLQNFYFVDALQSIGLKAQVLSAGKFKSFGEIFTRKGPSQPAQKQMKRLVESKAATINKILMEARPEAKWLDAFEAGFLSPEEANDIGILDYVMYYPQWESSLVKNQSKVSLEQAVNLLKPFKTGFCKTSKVSVLIANGNITDSHEPKPETINGLDYEKTLKEIGEAEPDHLIIRINSPGGSAYASDRIWSSIMTATNQTLPTSRPISMKKNKKQDNKKPKKQIPVWVSQSEVAASGGYFLSACSNQVFSTPLTITGSIGVVMASLEASNALKKLKLYPHSYSIFPQSNLYSWTKPINSDQKKILQENISSMYKLFKSRIITGRNMDENELEKNAQGRVFSGSDALEAGLVDQVGGFLHLLEEVSQKTKGHFDLKFYPQIKPSLFKMPGKKIFSSIVSPLWQMFSKPGEVNFIDPRFLEKF